MTALKLEDIALSSMQATFPAAHICIGCKLAIFLKQGR